MSVNERLMWQQLPGADGLPPSLSRGTSTTDGGPAHALPGSMPLLGRQVSDMMRTNAGDRILLPPSMLEACLSASDGNFPMTFEIRAYNGTRTYVGVQEFTSPSEVVSLPRSVIEALNLRTGADELNSDKMVTVKYIRLPKATSIKLSPLTSDFLDITDPRAFLETALQQNFTVLSNGQILTLRHEGFNYQLVVTDLQPSDAPAATIVNTDCVVDIGPPMDGGNSRRRATASLKLGEQVAGTVNSGEYVYYSLSIPREVDFSVYDVTVEAAKALPAPASGSPAPDPNADADVYISRGDVRKPTLVSHSWSITVPGGGRVFLVEEARDDVVAEAHKPEAAPTSVPSTGAPGAAETVADFMARAAAAASSDPSSRMFYIGVHGYGGKVHFTLKADIVEKSAVPKPLPVVSVLRTARTTSGTTVTAAAAAALGAAPVATPGTKLCPSCGAAIPEANYAMHAAMCARNVVKCPHPGCGAQLRRHAGTFVEHWHCPTCSLVMHEHVGKKHVALVHTPLACECGKHLPYHELRAHARTDCPARLVVCRFCGASTRAGPPPSDAVDRMHGLTEHEAYCGSRTGVCSFEGCNARLRLKDNDVHYAAFHPGVPVVPATVPMDLASMPSASPSVIPETSSEVSMGEDPFSLGPSSGDRPAWSCPTCTYSNVGSAAFCHMCSTARPSLPAGAPSSVASGSSGSGQPRAAGPSLCANQTCANPVSRYGDAAALRMCPRCFRLIAQEYEDTDALAVGMTTRYNTQLEAGCGDSECRNPYCATGRNVNHAGGRLALTRTDSVSIANDLVALMAAATGADGQPPRYYVCVSTCQRPLIRALQTESDVPDGAPSTAAPSSAADAAPAAAAAAESGLLSSMAGGLASLFGMPGATTSTAPAAAPAARRDSGSSGGAASRAAAAADRDRKSRIASAYFK